MFAFFVIAVAAAEAAVGLAIVLAFYRLQRPSAPTKPTCSRTERRRDGTALQASSRRTNFTLLAVILLLPALGAFVNGVFGKRLGKEAVRLMALAAIGGSFVASLIAFAMLVAFERQARRARRAPRASSSWSSRRGTGSTCRPAAASARRPIDVALQHRRAERDDDARRHRRRLPHPPLLHRVHGDRTDAATTASSPT